MFGERLNEILKEKGLSQRELSEKCGITEATISRYINNQRIPKMDIFKKIADTLNVDVSVLLSNNISNDKPFIGKSCNIYRDEKIQGNVVILTNAQRISILEDDLVQFLNMNKK